jgi:hypothetical protein
MRRLKRNEDESIPNMLDGEAIEEIGDLLEWVRGTLG